MNKETILKLIDMIIDKKEEIVKLSKDAYRSTIDGQSFQGWHRGVLIDTDGDISSFYRSQNSESMAEFNGEAIAAVTFTTGNEVPNIEYKVEDLTSEEITNFKNWLVSEEILTSEELEAEWENELNYSNLSDFDNNIIERIDKEAIECDVDNCYAEAAEEKIENTLQNLQLELENIEMYENVENE